MLKRQLLAKVMLPETMASRWSKPSVSGLQRSGKLSAAATQKLLQLLQANQLATTCVERVIGKIHTAIWCRVSITCQQWRVPPAGSIASAVASNWWVWGHHKITCHFHSYLLVFSYSYRIKVVLYLIWPLDAVGYWAILFKSTSCGWIQPEEGSYKAHG